MMKKAEMMEQRIFPWKLFVVDDFFVETSSSSSSSSMTMVRDPRLEEMKFREMETTRCVVLGCCRRRRRRRHFCSNNKKKRGGDGCRRPKE